MTEKNIVFEGKKCWIYKYDTQYTIYITGCISSFYDSSYAMNADGLSIAMCRAKYLERH